MAIIEQNRIYHTSVLYCLKIVYMCAVKLNAVFKRSINTCFQVSAIYSIERSGHQTQSRSSTLYDLSKVLINQNYVSVGIFKNDEIYKICVLTALRIASNTQTTKITKR